MAVLYSISSDIFWGEPLSGTLIQARILQQWAVYIIVFELAEESYFHKLRKHGLRISESLDIFTLIILKLLHKIFVVHCDHPLERRKEISCIDFNNGSLLQYNFTLIFVLFFLNKGADWAAISANLAWWNSPQDDNI